VGLPKTARKVAGELAFDRTYYQHLSHLTGLVLAERDLELRTMDVEHPDLPAGSFDGIGVEEMLALNIHNEYKAHIIAPSFHAAP
jgi:hypothetical protein